MPKKEKDISQYEMDLSGGKVPTVKEIKNNDPIKKMERIILSDEEVKEDDSKVLGGNINFIIVDIETTGISAKAEKLTEIVALRYDGGFNYLSPVYHNLLNPNKKIPKFISDLTGITDEMVKYKPFGHSGVKEFAKGINVATDILVAHNAKFEYDWLTHYEEVFKLSNWICTRAVYLFMRDGNTWDNNYTKNYSKLENVCDFYGIDYNQEDAHRAEYDVLKTAIVANLMISKIGIKRCLDISEAYIQGKGFGYKPKKKINDGGVYG